MVNKEINSFKGLFHQNGSAITQPQINNNFLVLKVFNFYFLMVGFTQKA